MSEGQLMRDHLEPLLLSANVDLFINGHVHAYERTLPVANGELARSPSSGIPHITIGDGGNREGFAYQWNEPQPDWSAIREYAYGYGTLKLNQSHAVWRWMRNDDPWNPPPRGTLGDEAVYARHTSQ